jgi:hypothetical protein
LTISKVSSSGLSGIEIGAKLCSELRDFLEKALVMGALALNFSQLKWVFSGSKGLVTKHNNLRLKNPVAGGAPIEDPGGRAEGS